MSPDAPACAKRCGRSQKNLQTFGTCDTQVRCDSKWRYVTLTYAHPAYYGCSQRTSSFVGLSLRLYHIHVSHGYIFLVQDCTGVAGAVARNPPH
eukprot:4659258-Amphidinium_carterae.6